MKGFALEPSSYPAVPPSPPGFSSALRFSSLSIKYNAAFAYEIPSVVRLNRSREQLSVPRQRARTVHYLTNASVWSKLGPRATLANDASRIPLTGSGQTFLWRAGCATDGVNWLLGAVCGARVVWRVRHLRLRLGWLLPR